MEEFVNRLKSELDKKVINDKNIPNLITNNETKIWYKNGKIHRDCGPAVIEKNGTKIWYKNGHIHRDRGPAVIFPDGFREWYQDGKLYKEK